MASIRRLAVDVACPGCARPNPLLLPESACGNEFVWHVRCRACGAWRWFHSRQEEAFVRAVKETSRRRGEPGGLSPEGTREAHAAFEATVDPCGCGGRFGVVMAVEDVPCSGCGGRLLEGPLSADGARPVDVAPLRE